MSDGAGPKKKIKVVTGSARASPAASRAGSPTRAGSPSGGTLDAQDSSREQLLTDDQAHLPSELDPRLPGQVVSKPPRSWRRCLRKASLSMSSFNFSKDVWVIGQARCPSRSGLIWSRTCAFVDQISA